MELGIKMGSAMEFGIKRTYSGPSYEIGHKKDLAMELGTNLDQSASVRPYLHICLLLYFINRNHCMIGSIL